MTVMVSCDRGGDETDEEARVAEAQVPVLALEQVDALVVDVLDHDAVRRVLVAEHVGHHLDVARLA